MSAIVSVTRHEKALRAMRCVVSDRHQVTLHHCHGGSMLDLGAEFPNPGMGQRNNPFLQIPLVAEYHVGQNGIDQGMGVKSWEEKYGDQVTYLKRVNWNLPYDLWEQARLWQQKNRKALRIITPSG